MFLKNLGFLGSLITWLSKTNGYSFSWVFGATGLYYSSVSSTGFKPLTAYFSIGHYNGNDFSVQITRYLQGQKQSDGLWENICMCQFSVNAKTLRTYVVTLPVDSGKEEVIYTRLRCDSTNRDSTVRLATYLEN